MIIIGTVRERTFENTWRRLQVKLEMNQPPEKYHYKLYPVFLAAFLRYVVVTQNLTIKGGLLVRCRTNFICLLLLSGVMLFCCLGHLFAVRFAVLSTVLLSACAPGSWPFLSLVTVLQCLNTSDGHPLQTSGIDIAAEQL